MKNLSDVGGAAVTVDRMIYLDGLRGVAAAVVFFGHLLFAINKGIWVLNGNAAVCVFFVLSGYVLSDLTRRSPLNFLAQATRRYTRLVFPMLITSAFAWALLALGAYRNVEAATITGSDWLASWYRFEPSFFGMISEMFYGVFASGESAYNCNLWTMRPELIGSLCVFLIGVVTPLRAARALCYLALGAWFWSNYILLFSVGALICEFQTEIASVARRTIVKALLLAAGVFFCVATEDALAKLHFPELDALRWHMFGATLVVLSVLTWPFLQNILGNSVGRWLGRISFTLYLIHVPIICSLTSWIILAAPRQIAFPAAVLTTILVVFAASTATYRLVDAEPTRWSRAIGYRLQRALEFRRAAAAMVR